MAKYQFTMFADKYKPVSTVVEADFRMDFAQHKKPYRDALIKICVQRSWEITDLKKFGYDTWKVRKVEEV